MGGGYGGNRLPASESDNGSRADSGPFRANAYVGLPGVNLGLEFGHLESVARSGQNSLAQGLPWVGRK
jgi:hypothetical protein